MDNNDDDNWLEGAFLAQEEFDRDKDKWKGKRQEMENHFLSTYDTLPDTRDDSSGSYTSSSGGSGSAGDNVVWSTVVVIAVIVAICFFLILASG